jgi:DNA modification methylase
MSYKLILGDCLQEIDKLASVDHVLTSPPYNRKRNDKYLHFKDQNNNWYEMNKQVITKLLAITKGYIFYNIQANYYNRADVYRLIGDFANEIKEIIIWEKSNPMPASGNSITNSVEYFLVLGNKPLKSNKTYTKNIITTSVNSNMPKIHKAVMKQEVSDYFINNFTQEGETVLDCFSGLATTGVSCLKNNRNYIGIELEEVYYNESIKILEKLS